MNLLLVMILTVFYLPLMCFLSKHKPNGLHTEKYLDNIQVIRCVNG